MRSVEPLRLITPSWCWPRPNSASLAGELNVARTVWVATPSTVAAVKVLLASERRGAPLRSVYATTPVISLTITLIRLVVIVTVPDASDTQNGVGVLQLLLTDSDALAGSAFAVV